MRAPRPRSMILFLCGTLFLPLSSCRDAGPSSPLPAEVRLRLELSSTEARPGEPIEIRATVENRTSFDVEVVNCPCDAPFAPGIQIFDSQGDEVWVSDPCTRCGAPCSLGPIAVGKSITQVVHFAGLVSNGTGCDLQTASPGEYTVVARASWSKAGDSSEAGVVEARDRFQWIAGR